VGKNRRNQNTDQLEDYNVEQLKNQLEILYCLWQLAVENDTSVEKDLEQTVQRHCNERVFGAANFSAVRYDDEQPNYWGGSRLPCRLVSYAYGRSINAYFGHDGYRPTC